jgi:ABC-type dipeptide/oligopeptide/nickel transport system permease subunit
MVSSGEERTVGRGDGATTVAQPALADAARGRLAQKKSPSYATRAWRRFRRNRLSLVSMVIFVIMILFSYGAPLISKYVTKTGFGDQNLQATFAPAGKTVSAIQIGGPNSGKTVTTKYILGADELGRDVLTRLAYGGRISLTVSFLTLAIALTVGLLIGALAGYYGGWVDTILMRLVDIFISVPGLFVLILVSTTINNNKLITGTSFYRANGWLILPFVIAVLSWTGISRLIRGEFLSLKSRDYVDAARVLGSTDGRIIVRHILPNVVPIERRRPISVTLDRGAAIRPHVEASGNIHDALLLHPLALPGRGDEVAVRGRRAHQNWLFEQQFGLLLLAPRLD